MTTDNNTDSFAMFLEMMNTDGGNTTNSLRNEEQTYKESLQQEPVFEDEPEAEQTFEDEPDFESMLSENGLIFEDEDPEAFERNSKGSKTKDDDDFANDDEEAEQETEQPTTPEGEESYNDETYDIDVNDFITLDDGREITIGELQERYLEDERFNQRVEEIAAREQAFEQQRASLSDSLKLAQLEADLELQDLSGVDWEYLASTNPQEYAAHKQWQERLLARKNAITHELAKQESLKEQVEQQAFQQKAQACVATLKTKIPYWSDDHYTKLLDFAIDKLGYDEDSATKEINPNTVYTWHTLFTLQQGAEKVKGRRRVIGSASKHISSGASNNPAKTKETIDKAKAARAFSEGKISHEQAFAMLED